MFKLEDFDDQEPKIDSGTLMSRLRGDLKKEINNADRSKYRKIAGIFHPVTKQDLAAGRRRPASFKIITPRQALYIVVAACWMNGPFVGGKKTPGIKKVLGTKTKVAELNDANIEGFTRCWLEKTGGGDLIGVLKLLAEAGELSGQKVVTMIQAVAGGPKKGPGERTIRRWAEKENHILMLNCPVPRSVVLGLLKRASDWAAGLQTQEEGRYLT